MVVESWLVYSDAACSVNPVNQKVASLSSECLVVELGLLSIFV